MRCICIASFIVLLVSSQARTQTEMRRTRAQGSGTVQLPLSGEQLAAAIEARKDLRGVSGARALLETRAELAADAPWAGKVLFDQQICAVLVLFNSFSMHFGKSHICCLACEQHQELRPCPAWPYRVWFIKMK